MRISILGVFWLLALFFSSNIIFAEDASFSASYSAQIQPTGNDIGVSRVTPDSSLYFLKTVRENIELRLALTPHVKLVRQLEFATRRLRESKSLVGTHEDLIIPTMERYWYHLSRLPVIDSATLIIHLEVLQNIYDRLINPQAKLSIRSVINKTSKRPDLPTFAKISVCFFLQKEATNSAITETERAILLERAGDCFKETGHKI